MVHEAAAAGLDPQRPAHGVGDLALAVVLGPDLPELFHADAELLRFAAFGEVELRDDLLGERAPHALGDEDIFAKELHAGLKSSLGWPSLPIP